MKKRLDLIMVERGLTRSRRVARDLIKQGSVKVNGEVIKKQGKSLSDNIEIELLASPTYVSRAGYKLEHAFHEFKIDAANKIALDIGASTGGFTDCLLQHGAQKVYAVEVGTNQLSDALKQDKRVVSMEKTDIRSLKSLQEKADIVTIDVSFISLTQVLPEVPKFLKNDADVIALIKPQFEVPREKRKKGVINSEEVRNLAKKKITKFVQDNWLVKKITDSPISGASGNQEFLIHLRYNTAGKI